LSSFVFIGFLSEIKIISSDFKKMNLLPSRQLNVITTNSVFILKIDDRAYTGQCRKDNTRMNITPYGNRAAPFRFVRPALLPIRKNIHMGDEVYLSFETVNKEIRYVAITNEGETCSNNLEMHKLQVVEAVEEASIFRICESKICDSTGPIVFNSIFNLQSHDGKMVARCNKGKCKNSLSTSASEKVSLTFFALPVGTDRIWPLPRIMVVLIILVSFIVICLMVGLFFGAHSMKKLSVP
jgi:hypothetical protein